jgi:hypothetical protein
MFNKQATESGLLNKSSNLAVAFAVTTFITIIDIFLVTLLVLLISDLDVPQAGHIVWPIKQKLKLSSSFCSDQIHNNHSYAFGHTLL